MSTDHEHSSPEQFLEDPESWSLWAIGIASALLVITTVVFVAGVFYTSQGSEALDKNVNVRYEQRNMVQDAQQAALDEAAKWVEEKDPETGETKTRLVIPIDQAMDIVSGNMN